MGTSGNRKTEPGPRRRAAPSQHVAGSFEVLAEHEWPPARTEWTTLQPRAVTGHRRTTGAGGRR